MAFVEGVADTVWLAWTGGVIVITMTLFYLYDVLNISSIFSSRATIHPDNQEHVDATRDVLNELPRGRPRDGAPQTCPVCLGSVEFGVETNCSHLFCAQCLITYWRHGRWGSVMSCPCCRQGITIMLISFTAEERADTSLERQQFLNDIRAYNRRYSGEPRSIGEYVSEAPALLRHLISDLFSVDGMVFIVRLKILFLIIGSMIYILLPMDLLPEALLGVFGLVDDILVVACLAIYGTVIYRQMLAAE